MSAVIVAATLGLIVLGAIFGSVDTRMTPSRVFVLAVPIAVVAGAAVMTDGITALWALVLGVIVTLSVLTAFIGPRQASRAGIFAGGLGAVILTGLVVRWGALIIATLAHVDAKVTAVLIVVALVATAMFPGARRGQARIAFVAAIVTGVLCLVCGVALGTPSQITTSYVPTAAISTTDAVGLAIAVILIGLGHPGLRAARVESPRSVIIGAVVAGAVTFAVLVGLIFLLGGALAFPSWPLSVLAVYLEPAAPVTSLLVALVVVVAGAASVSSAVAPLQVAMPTNAPGAQWIVPVVCGVLALAVVVAPIEVAGWVGLVAILSVIALVVNWRHVPVEAPLSASATQ